MSKNKNIEISLEEKLEKALVPIDEQPYKLPDSWVWTRLGEIFYIERGGSPRPIADFISHDENAINWIKIGDTQKNQKYIYSTKEKIKEEGMKKSKYVQSGDLILTNSMSFGKPYILKCSGCIHDGWLLLHPENKKLEIEYFYYLLTSPAIYEKFSNSAKGSTVKNLNKDLVKPISIPLPPLNEQKRIVEKLDFLFDKTKKAKEIIEEIKVDIENRKISILDRAFKGILSSKWRNENKTSDVKELLKTINDEKIKKWEEECLQAEKEGKKKPKKPTITEIEDMIVPVDEQPYKLPDSWVWVRNSSLTEIIGDGLHGTPNYTQNGDYYFINGSNLKDLKIKITPETKRVDKSEYEKFKKKLRNSTILLSINGTLGNIALYKDEKILLGKSVAYLNFITTEIVPFITFLLRSPYFKLFCEENYTGSTIKNIPLSALRDFLVPLPPLEEQQEIVRILDEVLENENKVKELLELEEKIDILEKSILHKAFKGELGTQNNDDVSALELLKEIL